jgi:DNA polymerase III subunit chi
LALAEVVFYHLERQPLEAVLPNLLEKTLERGWFGGVGRGVSCSLERGWLAVVQSGSAERLDALDEALWTYRTDSFLPHGQARDGNEALQPVFLTTGDETPNSAGVRFLVDGALPATFEGFTRIVFLFDGGDTEAILQARHQWKAAKSAGCAVAYWQQNDTGRWEKKA